MKKINVAELLKDCSADMKLDSVLYDNVYFDKVEHNLIKCYIQTNTCRIPIIFDKYGGLLDSMVSKCTIFPKGKTTWKGFRAFKE
jgi:hypothetical protein